MDQDATVQDCELGVCPIPVYNFDPEDFEVLMREQDLEAIRDTLRRLDILQYFFPAPDQVALGLVDRSKIGSSAQLEQQILKSPDLGHPFGSAEITRTNQSITEVIDELKRRKLVVEGEYALEITS